MRTFLLTSTSVLALSASLGAATAASPTFGWGCSPATNDIGAISMATRTVLSALLPAGLLDVSVVLASAPTDAPVMIDQEPDLSHSSGEGISDRLQAIRIGVSAMTDEAAGTVFGDNPNIHQAWWHNGGWGRGGWGWGNGGWGRWHPGWGNGGWGNGGWHNGGWLNH